MSALQSKRAELAGQIDAVQKHIDQLRADLVHVDAVLRLFAPDAQPDAIPARRPYRRRRWFNDGELPRRILDTLLASDTPLSANEIAGRIMVAKGLDPGDVDAGQEVRPELPQAAKRDTGAAGRAERTGWVVASCCRHYPERHQPEGLPS